MSSKNHCPNFDTKLITVARYHAYRLKRYSCFAGHDIEDLQQELIIEVLRYLPHYDANRSQLQTFINHILTKYAFKLLRAATCAKRFNPYPTVLLEDLEDGEDTQEEIALKALLMRLVDNAPSSRTRDLSIDIKRALLKLPPRLARLCELVLQGNTVTELAQSLGRSRKALYEDFHTIRQFFERMGLQEYCHHFIPVSLKKGLRKRLQTRK